MPIYTCVCVGNLCECGSREPFMTAWDPQVGDKPPTDADKYMCDVDDIDKLPKFNKDSFTRKQYHNITEAFRRIFVYCRRNHHVEFEDAEGHVTEGRGPADASFTVITRLGFTFTRTEILAGVEPYFKKPSYGSGDAFKVRVASIIKDCKTDRTKFVTFLGRVASERAHVKKAHAKKPPPPVVSPPVDPLMEDLI